MKKTFAAVAIFSALAVSTAQAGSLSDPIVTPAIVMEDASASSSSSGELYLLMFGILMLAVTS